MRLRLALAVVATLLLSSCGAGTRTSPAETTPPLTLLDLLQDPEAARARQALEDPATPWSARLEAERLLRRDHPEGGAPALEAIARRTRSALERSATLEAIAASYPAEAGPIFTRLAEAFAHEPRDRNQLAATALRYQIVGAYAATVPLLVRSGVDDVFRACGAGLRAGPALAPVLRTAQVGSPRMDLILRLLASGAAGTAPSATDVAELARQRYPAQALALYAEVAGAAAPPVLEAALREATWDAQLVAAAALARRQVDAAAPAILALLQAHATEPDRGPLLLALGVLRQETDEDLLVREAHDATRLEDADGTPRWPVAEAALEGLGHLHGEAGHDCLRALCTRSDRPAVALASGRALAARGDRHDVPLLQAGAEALYRQGHALEASELADARDQLLGVPERRRDRIAYLIRSSLADGTAVALLADTPLVAIPEGGHGIADHAEGETVTQLTVPLARAEVMRAIELRNARRLAQLRVAGAEIQFVDLLAR